jgi:NitT/TauT family transport system substrate-binding protein
MPTSVIVSFMIRRLLAALLILAAAVAPAAANEKFTVATTRDVQNGALFLAALRGYFAAAGVDLAMQAYPSPKAVVEALAAGNTDLAVTSFTATAFNLAGTGKIKIIGAQVREKTDHEGDVMVAANSAFHAGLHTFGDIANRSVAITSLGSVYNYQLGRIAELKKFKLNSVIVKPMHTLDEVAAAVIDNRVDGALLPSRYGRSLLASGQAQIVGWYSELDEQQLGALFASAKTLKTRAKALAKFIAAYRRGAADYSAVMSHYGLGGKLVSNVKSRKAAAQIARYVYPGTPQAAAVTAVEQGAYYMDPKARLDPADVARQFNWFKAQGLVQPNADLQKGLDLSYVGTITPKKR